MRVLALPALIGCIFGFAATGSAFAGDDAYPREIAGPVAAHVVKVRDGDTVEVEAFVWPMQSVHVAVRLRGIDAPEKRGKCDGEKAAAARATRASIWSAGSRPRADSRARSTSCGTDRLTTAVGGNRVRASPMTERDTLTLRRTTGTSALNANA